MTASIPAVRTIDNLHPASRHSVRNVARHVLATWHRAIPTTIDLFAGEIAWHSVTAEAQGVVLDLIRPTLDAAMWPGLHPDDAALVRRAMAGEITGFGPGGLFESAHASEAAGRPIAERSETLALAYGLLPTATARDIRSALQFALRLPEVLRALEALTQGATEEERAAYCATWDC